MKKAVHVCAYTPIRIDYDTQIHYRGTNAKCEISAAHAYFIKQ